MEVRLRLNEISSTMAKAQDLISFESIDSTPKVLSQNSLETRRLQIQIDKLERMKSILEKDCNREQKFLSRKKLNPLKEKMKTLAESKDQRQAVDDEPPRQSAEQSFSPAEPDASGPFGRWVRLPSNLQG